MATLIRALVFVGLEAQSNRSNIGLIGLLINLIHLFRNFWFMFNFVSTDIRVETEAYVEHRNIFT